MLRIKQLTLNLKEAHKLWASFLVKQSLFRVYLRQNIAYC